LKGRDEALKYLSESERHYLAFHHSKGKDRTRKRIINFARRIPYYARSDLNGRREINPKWENATANQLCKNRFHLELKPKSRRFSPIKPFYSYPIFIVGMANN
jgi:hypothetical protein